MSEADKLVLAWDSSKPVRIFDLHSALKEALCVRHVLEFILDIPNTRRDLSYDERTGKLTYELTDTLSRKTYTLGIADTYHMGGMSISVGDFMQDVFYSQDLWFAASREDRANLFEASFIARHVDAVIASMQAKGFDCRRRRPKVQGSA